MQLLIKLGNSRWGAAAMILALWLPIAGTILLFRATGLTEDGSEGPSTAVFLGFVIALLITVTVYALVALVSLVVGIDPYAEIIADHLTTDEPSRELLQRWLDRMWWFRNVGGLSGLVLWFFLTTGNGQGLDLNNIFVFGGGGVLAGAMVAEWHQVRGRNGPRTASLAVRSVGRYLHPKDRRRFWALSVVWLALLILGLLHSDARGVVGYAIGGLLLLTLTRGLQRRVATRTRPHLPVSLTNADDLARDLAITRSLARPANIVALALLIPGVAALVPLLDGNAADVLGLVVWLVAAVWWWQNRRLGLDWLVHEGPDSIRPVSA